MNLYKEILQDLRGERKQDKARKVEALKREIRETEEKLNTIDDKLCCGTIADETHKRISDKCLERIKELNQQITLLSEDKKGVKEKIDYSINLINNLTNIMMDAPVAVKCKLIGSMFFDKIVYDGKHYRTKNYNQVLDLIFQETNKLRGYEKGESEDSPASVRKVPRAEVRLIIFYYI